MKKILSIASYTFIENVRNKVFYVMALFGVMMLGAAFLLSALGGQQVERILLDLGLGAIEFFALLAVVYSSVMFVLEELESKTIYLILSRPVSRFTYLAGRYFGLLAAAYCGMFLMALLHSGLLLAFGWDFTLRYILALLLSAEKIAVIGSMAVFFSVFSSSAVVSISFTLFFWILGHFSEEMLFLSKKLSGFALKAVFKAAYFIIPNLQYFNLKDFWDVPNIMGKWIFTAAGYGALYCAFFLALTLVFFNRKEF